MKNKFKFMAFLCIFAMVAISAFSSCVEEEEEKNEEPTLYCTWKVLTDEYHTGYLGVTETIKYDDNDYIMLTITQDTFKEEIYKEGKLADTQTYKLSVIQTLPSRDIEKGSVQVCVGYLSIEKSILHVGFPNGAKNRSPRTYNCIRVK